MTTKTTKTGYSATVLRFYDDPRVGEFVNLGVLVLHPSTETAPSRITTQLERTLRFFPGTDEARLRCTLGGIASWLGRQHRVRWFDLGNISGIAQRALPDHDHRFQWSTPTEGTTDDPERTLDILYQALVARYEPPPGGAEPPAAVPRSETRS